MSCSALAIAGESHTVRGAASLCGILCPDAFSYAMGSDAQGKQELPTEIFRHAGLFCDLPEQSVRIGGFQHAGPEASPTAIGSVPSGDVPAVVA